MQIQFVLNPCDFGKIYTMEENEFYEPSFGDIVDLVKTYEDAWRSRQQVFFEEEDFEQVIQFYQENHELNKALRVIESALDQYSFSAFFHTKKAEILANQKRFEEALGTYLKNRRN